MSEKEVIAGKYDKGVISLVKGAADKFTLSHESVHYMEDIGVISPSETSLLKRHIQNLVSDGKFETVNEKDIGGAEDRANFLADALTRPPKGLLGRILNKIHDFIDKLVNAFGIRTVRGIQRDVETGDIYRRESEAQREARLDLEGGLTKGEESLLSIAKDINNKLGEKGSIDFEPIVKFGQKIWDAGHQTYEKFITKAKELFGNTWDKVKYLVKQAWDKISEERGSFSTKEANKYNRRAIKEYGLATADESIGYITRDGREIDSSGISQGSRSQGRNVDHREIAQEALGKESGDSPTTNIELSWTRLGI